MEGYCLKCKQSREMNNFEETMTQKGVRMARGTCSVCSTKMAKILGKKAA